MLKFSRIIRQSMCLYNLVPVRFQYGDPGSGAGKGGGGGGAIREAGGAFGKNQAAREEEYFHKKQAELLEKLRENEEEVDKLDEKKKCKEENKFDPDSCSVREFCTKSEHSHEDGFFYNYQLEVTNELQIGSKLEKIEAQLRKEYPDNCDRNESD